MVKTDLLNLYRHITRFAEVKNVICEDLQAFYTLSCDQNGLYKPLLPSNALCSDKDRLYEPPKVYHMLCGDQN